MGGWLSGNPDQPIVGIWPRIRNVLKNNLRGILGIVGLLFFIDMTKVVYMWCAIFWFFLLQPMPIACTSLIPIFYLPMFGVINTVNTTQCYFREGAMLFVLSSMLFLLLNNSGFDRRVIVYILGLGKKNSSFNEKAVLIKSSFAAFLLSIFSNRLIITSTVIQYVSPIYSDMETAKSFTKYDKLRYATNNAIQTSACIGGLVLVHASYTVLTARAIFMDSCLEQDHRFHDYCYCYNTMLYYTLPMAAFMFVCNLIYHVILMKMVSGSEMNDERRGYVRNRLTSYKNTIPEGYKIHEVLSVVFLVVALFLLFIRCPFGDPANLNIRFFQPDKLGDTTIIGFFVILMHCLPRTGFHFLKYLNVKKKSKLHMKPESSILFWRFVNANVVYSYFLVIGCGLAIDAAVRETGLWKEALKSFLAPLIVYEWKLVLLITCLICVLLANIMDGMAMVAVVSPLVLCLVRETSENNQFKPVHHLFSYAIGICGSLSLMWPFLHTPAYVCNKVGKVPMLTMAKYSVVSILLCVVILWLVLSNWPLFDVDKHNTCYTYKVLLDFAPAEPAAPPAEAGEDARRVA